MEQSLPQPSSARGTGAIRAWASGLGLPRQHAQEGLCWPTLVVTGRWLPRLLQGLGFDWAAIRWTQVHHGQQLQVSRHPRQVTPNHWLTPFRVSLPAGKPLPPLPGRSALQGTATTVEATPPLLHCVNALLAAHHGHWCASPAGRLVPFTESHPGDSGPGHPQNMPGPT